MHFSFTLGLGLGKREDVKRATLAVCSIFIGLFVCFWVKTCLLFEPFYNLSRSIGVTVQLNSFDQSTILPLDNGLCHLSVSSQSALSLPLHTFRWCACRSIPRFSQSISVCVLNCVYITKCLNVCFSGDSHCILAVSS